MYFTASSRTRSGAVAIFLPWWAAMVALGAPPERGTAAHWVTNRSGTTFVSRQADLPFSRTAAGGEVSITLFTDQLEQAMTGFGGAMTHSSAYLINTHPDREAIILELFGRDQAAGIGASMVRLPIGTSDYALPFGTPHSPPGPFSAQDDPSLPVGISPLSDQPTAPDRMTNPAYALDRDIIEVLQLALTHNPDLKFVAVPWSAPLRWKLNHPDNSFTGGSLDPAFEQAYADYFAEFVEFYSGHGIELWAVSIQNEPGHGGNTPSMTMAPEQSARMVVELDRAFTQRGLDTRIMVFDHNMEDIAFPRTVYTQLKSTPEGLDALERVIGTAWHIYDEDGDGDQEIGLMGAFQDELRDVIGIEAKQCWVTERTGSNPISFAGDAQWFWQTITYPAMSNEASGFLWWNFMLDEDGKPNLVGGDIYRSRGMYQRNADGTISRSAEAAILGHFSKFVEPGSRRITTGARSNGVDHLAFLNPDGSVVVVLYNNEWFDARSVELVMHAHAVQFELQPQMLTTLHFKQPGFAGWISRPSLGLSAGEMDPEADPDGDGVSNFIEYAIGSEPATAGGDLADRRLRLDGAGSEFGFHVGQEPSQLSYQMQLSTNLNDWEPLELTNGPLLKGMDYRQEIDGSRVARGRVFIRLMVGE